ncbi:P-type conjugative transfer protein TrbL [Pseudomonas kurunegalensis]|uniref:P-type conjugative transfer protein TrbL n=1 Tax=Pseudomonas kurunegalensis TaxID=485880 RepID=UPI0025708A41|nr:P-type conjugative transfer protein TrbL [Pseudomonas kurunegalensis]WJD63090.1 P-type conjugative transfer protein TrbL [Pseudomonas kurunegalensis]
MKRSLTIYLAMTALSFSKTALAGGLDSGNMLNKILDSFSTVATTWQSEITSSASWLFWSLALISMVWTYGLMALRNADLQSFFAETVRFFGTMSFFWWLLQSGPAISMSIINTMRAISAKAAGLGTGLSPSSIVDIGFGILTKVSASASLLSPVVSALMLAAAIVVLVILALIAVNMLLLLVSAWLLAYAGIFLLGFGGSRWTSDIAISFYKTVLGIGVQLFTMTFLIGVGKSFLDQYYRAFATGTPDLNSLCVLLVASVILLSLVNKLPPTLAGIVGSTGQNAGIGSFGAGAAIGAATVAASALASAGTTVLAGAKEIAGGSSALSAAFKAAQAGLDNPSNDSGNVDLGGEQHAEGAPAQSAFAQAMGTSSSHQGLSSASRHPSALVVAANAGSLLAEHAGQSIRDRANLAVAGTVGGRLAAAINASINTKAEVNPDLEKEIDGTESDEVAKFVNKDQLDD